MEPTLKLQLACVLLSPLVYGAIWLVMRWNVSRENIRSQEASQFWARYQPAWMSERLCGEHSQEYLDWRHEGRQKGYL